MYNNSLDGFHSWEDTYLCYKKMMREYRLTRDFNFITRYEVSQSVLLRCTRTYLRNRKHVLCFYRVIQTRVEVWENEKCCGNTSRRRVFPQLFRVLSNFHECLYNSIETPSTGFLFLLENNATRKKKTNC